MVAALVIVLAHVPSFFHRLLDGDEAIYGSIAALMNLGGRLYADGGVDNKPPGIFWVYAATFRVAGTYQMTAIHAVGLIVMLATCWLAFRHRPIAVRRARRPAGGADLRGPHRGRQPQAPGLEHRDLHDAAADRLRPFNAAAPSGSGRGRFWWRPARSARSAAINLLLVPARDSPNGAAEQAVTRVRLVRRRLGRRASLVGAALLAATGSLVGFWDWTIGTLYGYASSNWTPALV